MRLPYLLPGLQLTKGLLAKGYKVLAGARNPPSDLRSLGAEVHAGNVSLSSWYVPCFEVAYISNDKHSDILRISNAGDCNILLCFA